MAPTAATAVPAAGRINTRLSSVGVETSLSKRWKTKSSDENIRKYVDAIANVAIREREVQRPLHLPTELLCLPFGLAVRRQVA